MKATVTKIKEIKNGLYTVTKKTKYGYVGYVQCWDSDFSTTKPIWVEKAGPTRINRTDAAEDSLWLKKDRTETYKGLSSSNV